MFANVSSNQLSSTKNNIMTSINQSAALELETTVISLKAVVNPSMLASKALRSIAVGKLGHAKYLMVKQSDEDFPRHIVIWELNMKVIPIY